ncbi:unnamed protein product [Phaedon cochleariae]|uniref:protein-tyrosine-phosphatase n=1 Tax=Phaedon cochleariae TaxID=80249 RepID=A0A9P0DNL8_PHACE|nr:unnamed protein product [Phaedon cochleariae]
MWDTLNNDPCDACQLTRSSRMMSCEAIDDPYLDKENVQSFSMKSEELSMYDSGSPLPCRETSPTHCTHSNRRPLEEHDSNSQDSGYGASYHGEKFLSFGSSSMCSMEDEFLDFSDVEPLEKPNLPKDFNKLITNPLILKGKERTSPRDPIIKPSVFRRALSLQNTACSGVTPNSSRVRTSLFKADAENRSFKRPEPPNETETSVGVKRSRMFEDSEDDEEAFVPQSRPTLQRAFSATEESIMYAVQKSSTDPDLIGDFSRSFSLPLTRSRHQDLKAITAQTLARLMEGNFDDAIGSYKVIDCRYPYEFEGGHIEGATNIYTKEQCMELLADSQVTAQNSTKRHILVFHCEFSSERGPNLYRYLRKEDRHKNESDYPSLNYPEIYLLEGGYKTFFQQFSEMCTPVAYKEMNHPDHEEDLRHFRQKSKTWNCDSRNRLTQGRSIKRLGM